MRVKPESVKMTDVEKQEWDELYRYVKKKFYFMTTIRVCPVLFVLN